MTGMIIGIDASRSVTGQRTGTEAYAYFLIQALISLTADSEHHLRLYFNQPPPPGLFPDAPHVEQVIIPLRRLWTHIRLSRELHTRPPDIFFTPAHLIPYTYHGRSAATIHDLGYHHFPEAHPKRQLAYLKWSTRHNGRRAQTIFADSQATKDDLIQLDGLEANKIKVVYPGVDPGLRPMEDEDVVTAVIQKYGLTPPYFLYIGTIQPRKNLVRLIQAYAQSGVPHQLVLAGKPGWLSQPILQEISDPSVALRTSFQSPISKNIILPGYIHDTDKAALLTGATALLYPSLYEGFGFPILEAQVCGLPVLTADSSSCPEVAGDAALLVNSLDTEAIKVGIQQLAADGNLRQSLRQKGLENVRQFTWQGTAGQVLHTLSSNWVTG
ncbi:MAG: glycosyltransferase family 4 protein [Chloroflexi bacterium]|nr:glycosyltransferase family 4 protein [Chloroflexota bacterium]